MGLRERILHGKDQQFGEWFHQQCIFIRNNAEVGAKGFKNRKLAAVIDSRNAQQLDDLIGNYVNALFILYLFFVISEDKGEDYLAKHLTPMASVIGTTFGTHTLGLYQGGIEYISAHGVAPESAITHLMVDGLHVPLNQERDALENAFQFFEESLKELYVPVLEETYAHNSDALRATLEAFGVE